MSAEPVQSAARARSRSRADGVVRPTSRSAPARTAGRVVLLVVVALIVLFPVYTMVVASFKSGADVFRNPLLPDSFSFDTIEAAWTQGRLGRYLWNSLVVAVVVTFAQVATSLMSGYAFAMLDFPGRNAAFVVFLATLLVPLEATLLINRDTIDALGMLNSYPGLVLPFLATAFGTLLVRQSLLAFPPELRDAARLDGIGHLGFLWRIVVPLQRPVLGALALLSFLQSWGQYLWPNLIINSQEKHTVQSGLRLLSAGTDVEFPNLYIAGALLAGAPIALVILAFQRQLVRGLTAGATDG